MALPLVAAAISGLAKAEAMPVTSGGPYQSGPFIVGPRIIGDGNDASGSASATQAMSGAPDGYYVPAVPPANSNTLVWLAAGAVGLIGLALVARSLKK